MLRNRIGRFGLVTAGALVLTLSTSLASALELRTTSGSKTLVRRASYQAETQKSVEAEVLPAPLPAAGEPMELPLEFVPDALECGEPCVPACCLPSAAGRLWVDAEFLMWWRKGRYFPPLVTTDPNAGILPEATTLFGGQRVDESVRPGGRLELGLWLGPWQRFGIGGHFTVLSDAPIQFSITENEFPLFGRPYISAATAAHKTDLTATYTTDPDTGSQVQVTTGRLDLRATAEIMASDAFFRWGLWRGPRYRVDLLAGYQHARIDEQLTIDTYTEQDGTTPYPTKAVTDQFSTKNEFHGGHFGVLGECAFGRVGVELLAKFAFGNMRETAIIRGERTFTTSEDDSFTIERGLLAQPSNSGTRVQDDFSYMQEVGLKMTYYPVERLQLSLGYSLLYWSSVLQAGDTIDRVVDEKWLSNTETGTVHPAYRFNPKDLYLHGMNLGLEYRF